MPIDQEDRGSDLTADLVSDLGRRYSLDKQTVLGRFRRCLDPVGDKRRHDLHVDSVDTHNAWAKV